MSTHRNDGAAAPGPVAPTSDNARRQPGVERQGTGDSRDCRTGPASGQALRTIEGERKASIYLARLHAQQADADELALIVSTLYGPTLRGFCRALEKAIGGRDA